MGIAGGGFEVDIGPVIARGLSQCRADSGRAVDGRGQVASGRYGAYMAGVLLTLIGMGLLEYGRHQHQERQAQNGPVKIPFCRKREWTPVGH